MPRVPLDDLPPPTVPGQPGPFQGYSSIWQELWVRTSGLVGSLLLKSTWGCGWIVPGAAMSLGNSSPATTWLPSANPHWVPRLLQVSSAHHHCGSFLAELGRGAETSMRSSIAPQSLPGPGVFPVPSWLCLPGQSHSLEMSAQEIS